MKTGLLFGVLVGLIFNISVFAQDQSDQGEVDVLEYLKIEKTDITLSKSSSSLNAIRAKSAINGNFPSSEIWNKTPWADPKVNFSPLFTPTYAGDINGDGFGDFIKTTTASDERTSDLSDLATKTLVYFGGDNINSEYDQFLYYRVVPLGDLNGDSFSDALAYNIDGEVALAAGSASGYDIIDTPLENIQAGFIDSLIRTTSETLFQDLNSDNIDDIIGVFYSSEIGKSVFYELSGASSFSDLIYNEFVISSPQNPQIFNYMGIIERNDSTFYVFSTRGLENPNSIRFEAFFQEDTALVSRAAFEPALSTFSFGYSELKDFDGDGLKDLLIESSANEGAFLSLGTNEDPFFTIFEGDDVSNLIFDLEQLGYDFFNAVGDLDNDGHEEILFANDDKYSINSIDNTLEGLALIEEAVFNASDFLSESGFSGFIDRPFKITTADTSFLLNVVSDTEYKHIVLNIDQTVANSIQDATFQSINYNRSDYARESIRDIYSLADIEEDGKDNFALERASSGDIYLEFYNGFDKNSVDIMDTDDELTIRDVYAGNFLSTESKSIIVMFRPPNTDTVNTYTIQFYDPSDLQTSVHEIRMNDVDPELIRMEILANLGDINNDGYDDIGIAVPLSNKYNVYIYLGGSTISTNPDFIIDYTNPEIFGTTSSWGIGTLQGVGDLNADGIDDYLVGDHNRQFLSPASTVGGPINGAIFVHYGQDKKIPDFSLPDATLYPDTSTVENTQWFLGFNEIATGDFNGDGSIDIAAKSFRHANAEFSEGVGAIHYFFNKDGFDKQPDTTIAIRSEYIYTNEVPETYSRFGGRELLAGIPDLNGDGADELLYVAASNRTNAIIYAGGDSLKEEAGNIFLAPNNRLQLNPSGNFINVQYRSTVGDFNGDGSLGFIVFQADGNYRDHPLYWYALSGISVNNEEEINQDRVSRFSLEQNYPNPFNPSTNISFSIPSNTQVKLEVFNILGQKVKELVNSRMLAGAHTIKFDASSLSSGMYFYRIEAGKFSQTKKMLLIK